MSGRKGRGGGGNQTERTVANALGIDRQEMRNLQSKQTIEPPPLYPALRRSIMPLEGNSEELQYMADLKQEIFDGFRNSEFYLDKDDKGDIHRYIDKYNKLERGTFKPDFSRIPDELCWDKNKRENSKIKRKKVDELEDIAENLKRLEENEKEHVESDDDNEDSSERSEKSNQGDSDARSEDEAEEDNDYINNYFDNGEEFGDGGSDDNLGDDY